MTYFRNNNNNNNNNNNSFFFFFSSSSSLFFFSFFSSFFFFFHGLGPLTCSGIDALPSFLRSSTISSSSRFIFEGVFRQSGVAHSFKMVDPVLFVFGFHILYSRDFRNYPEYLQEGPRKPTNISEQPISEIRFCVINS